MLAPIVKRLTREPRPDSLEVDGVPVELVRPGGTGPWPAWVFMTGAHPLRRREPVVQRLAHGFARAGYIVLVPDLPGLGEGEITQRTLEAAVAVTKAAVALPDVRGARVALCGASAGASLALLTAQDPAVADRVTVVTAITPWADLERIVCLATTRHYEEDGRLVAYPVTPLLRRVVARSVVAALPPGVDRDSMLATLRAIESDDVDPCAELRRLEASLVAPEAQAVVRLLANEDPACFDELYAALPSEVASLVRSLSPVKEASSLRGAVELIRPPVDQYFPLGEAQALAASLPAVRLTVTGTLDHTRPSLALGRLVDLVHFNGFVIRGLAAAAS